MAKPNYQFDKRQRDLAKKKKQEEKLLKKRAGQASGTADDGAEAPAAEPEADKV